MAQLLLIMTAFFALPARGKLVRAVVEARREVDILGLSGLHPGAVMAIPAGL